MRVLVLNGPNLGRLGRRQPEIYGRTTYAELVTLCVDWGRDLGLEVEVRQTNHEGELLDWLNAAADERTPVVLNAAAWTHYSLRALPTPAPSSPRRWSRCTSATRPRARRSSATPRWSRRTRRAVIAGEGIDGYRQALAALLDPGRRRRWCRGRAGTMLSGGGRSSAEGEMHGVTARRRAIASLGGRGLAYTLTVAACCREVPSR